MQKNAPKQTGAKLTPTGFEPAPIKNGTWIRRLKPLGHSANNSYDKILCSSKSLALLMEEFCDSNLVCCHFLGALLLFFS